MPTLFRFFAVVSTICAIGYGALYTLAVQFEPTPREVADPLPSVKLRRE